MEGIQAIEDSEPYVSRRESLSLRVNKPSQWGYWPWIAVLSDQETYTTQYGTYVAYLFSASGDRVYLAMAKGTTVASRAAHQLKQEIDAAKREDRALPKQQLPDFKMPVLKARTEEYRKELPKVAELVDQGWVRGDQMKLSVPPGIETNAAKGAQATGRQYEASTVVAKEYVRGSISADAELLEDWKRP